jgi:alpha-ketoglutarate-dependent taurine dioxygenase
MTACDARAREVEEYLARQLPAAVACEWTARGQVLVVDNRHVLHARAAVAEGDAGRELTRVAFCVRDAQ